MFSDRGLRNVWWKLWNGVRANGAEQNEVFNFKCFVGFFFATAADTNQDTCLKFLIEVSLLKRVWVLYFSLLASGLNETKVFHTSSFTVPLSGRTNISQHS